MATATMRPVQAPEVVPPLAGDDWLLLTGEELPIGAVYEWAVRPDCGAVVLFSGTVRGGNLAGAEAIGKVIAERLKEKGISRVVFDRGGNLYHGRVRAVADAARKAGLEF